MRLIHVIDNLKSRGVAVTGMEEAQEVIKEMSADIMKESTGEIVESRESRAAIGRATARELKTYLRKQLEKVE